MKTLPLFITWAIWQILVYPPRQSAIFRHAKQADNKRQGRNYLLVLGSIIGGGLLILVLWRDAFLPYLLMLVALPILLFVSSGTILGLHFLWTSPLSSLQASQAYDLLRISPLGEMGTVWGYTAQWFYQRKSSYQVGWILQRITLILIILALLTFVFLLVGLWQGQALNRDNPQMNLLIQVLWMILPLLALWLDYLQSLIVAVLFGALLAHYGSETIFTRLIGLGLFLLLQGLVYTLVGLFYWLASLLMLDIIAFCLTLVAFYLVRESLIEGFVYALMRVYRLSYQDFFSLWQAPH